MGKKLWWQEQLNLIQYNLQIEDTPGMDAKVIAAQLKDSHTDAVIINAGGIYAWYQSKVPFHHINEYLPGDYDLLGALVEECHKQGIRVIARFDFSKTDDVVYLHHPEWFVKRDGGPVMYGKERMGNWSLLVTTCLNGGYRNKELAVPVLEEVMGNYDIDGVFLNAPQMETCFCENCRKKYKKVYGEDMPADEKEWHRDWWSRCKKDNIDVLYRSIKAKNADMPLILYYDTYNADGTMDPDNLSERYATADMICTEARDSLSNGRKKLPYRWNPTMQMKVGRVEGKPEPFGIIHSCPGMDWRHTGIPVAEYEFWMSQIPAAKGQLWHSLTGYEATITDKRILAAMKRVNHKNQMIKPYMESAVSDAVVLMLWSANISDLGMTEGLMEGKIPFDVMNVHQFDKELLKKYKVVLLPDSFPVKDEILAALSEYVEEGGNLITEKTTSEGLEELSKLLGIRPEGTLLEGITAAYGILEEDGAELRKGLEDTFYLPVHRNVLRVETEGDTGTLMTFVPPFAPLDGVGAPPERASMPVKRTNIPLITLRKAGKGRVMGIFFELSGLVLDYALEDQQLLFENCVSFMTGENEVLRRIFLPSGVYAYTYDWEKGKLIHLVNGIGERPIKDVICCRDASFLIKWDENRPVNSVSSVLEDSRVTFERQGGYLKITTDCVKVWDMIVIREH